ncbi:hypothetical protein MASR2M78_17800 [Treponema sp.]
MKYVFLPLLCLFFSCDILREKPFEVLSWTPGEGSSFEASQDRVSLLFSSQPDEKSVEEAFSLCEDGHKLRGLFAWQGRELQFQALSPLSATHEYLLSLAETAHDVEGVSLSSAFEGRFGLDPSSRRPCLRQSLPQNGALLSHALCSVQLEFSKPVDETACNSCISFSPDNLGLWRVSMDGYTAYFDPIEKWKPSTAYTLTVASDFYDRTGRQSGSDTLIHFSLGNETEAPVLLSTEAIDDQSLAVCLLQEGAGENTLWEASWRLRFNFSEEVNLEDLDTLLSVAAGPSLMRETDGSFACVAVYRFTEAPKWASRFTIFLEEGLRDRVGNAAPIRNSFHICADGPHSRPPRFVGLRFPLHPSSLEILPPAYPLEEPYAFLPLPLDSYPIDTPAVCFVELYFELAQDAVIDRFAIMEGFKVTATNAALSFSPRSLRLSNFSYAEPHLSWAHFTRVQIDGLLTNHSTAGLVSFILSDAVLPLIK